MKTRGVDYAEKAEESWGLSSKRCGLEMDYYQYVLSLDIRLPWFLQF